MSVGYEIYKASGIDWLGPIPEHWDVVPLKRNLVFLTSGSRGWADHYSEDGAIFIRIGNLSRDRSSLDLSDIQRVAVPIGAESQRTKVEPGDILFSITAYLGSVAVVPESIGDAYVSQHVALARLKHGGILPAWVAYVALSFVGKTYLETQGYGGTKVQLSLDDIANLPVVFPPLSEQMDIVTFLDRETAKIDALVEAQQQLIELLEEKRQAIISHAITRGLNAFAPQRASGVDWLGRVPGHWRIVPLKRAFNSVEYGISENLQAENGIAVLRMGNINGGNVNFENIKYVEYVEENLFLRKDDLLFNRTNSLDQIAKVGLFEYSPIECVTFASYLVRLRASSDCSPLFLKYFLNSREILTQARARAFVAIGQCNLNPTRYGEIMIALPPPGEQVEIANHLEFEIGRLDSLRAVAQSAITLLQERRAALISAAVTGKIDVREASARNAEAA